MNYPGVFPSWIQRHLLPHALSAVIGIGSFMAYSFLANMTEQRVQNARIEVLERQMGVVLAEQRLNSDYRVRNSQQWEDFREQYNRDRVSLLDGQRVILKTMHKDKKEN